MGACFLSETHNQSTRPRGQRCSGASRGWALGGHNPIAADTGSRLDGCEWAGCPHIVWRACCMHDTMQSRGGGGDRLLAATSARHQPCRPSAPRSPCLREGPARMQSSRLSLLHRASLAARHSHMAPLRVAPVTPPRHHGPRVLCSSLVYVGAVECSIHVV